MPSARIRLLIVLFVGVIGCGGGDRAAPPDASRVVDAPDLDIGPACLAPATPGEGLAPCICGTDCARGALCDPEATSLVPGGNCVRPCASDSECGPSGRCTTGAIGNCVPTCTASSECAEGRYCFDGTCTALCQADSQCASGNCDNSSGRCRAAGVTPTGAATSAACLRDEDCLSLICNGGTCLTPCARSAQGCPVGEFCLGDDSLIDAGQCLPLCETTADCVDPLADCTEVTDLGRTAKVCL